MKKTTVILAAVLMLTAAPVFAAQSCPKAGVCKIQTAAAALEQVVSAMNDLAYDPVMNAHELMALNCKKNAKAAALAQSARCFLVNCLAPAGADDEAYAAQLKAAHCVLINAKKAMHGPDAGCMDAIAKAVECLCAKCGVAEGGAAAAAGGSDEDQIKQVVATWVKGFTTPDVDTILSVYADDFEHYEVGDKEGLGEFLEGAVDMGYLEDVEVFTDDMEIDMDGEEAILYPIDLTSAAGAVTIELVLEKSDAGWAVIGMDIEGL